MLQPKRTKWRKNHLIRPKRQTSRENTIVYGQYGLVVTKDGYYQIDKLKQLLAF